MAKIFNNLTDLIGSTPLLRLHRLTMSLRTNSTTFIAVPFSQI